MVLIALLGQTVNAQWWTTGNGGSGLKLGLTDNNSLDMFTNNIQRVKLNPSVTYSVNGFNAARNGYMFLGHSQAYSSGVSAYSLLHLNGPNGTFVQDGGHRPWMQTGITLTDNNDMSYMGIRGVGSGTDITETVIAWSDNNGPGFPGPDDLSFRFTSGGSGVTSISTDKTTPSDLDGLHVARFTYNGNIGFGPTFGADNSMYVAPQSLLHLSRDGKKETWLQITNESATGQKVDDGLRIGVWEDRIALIRQQENQPLIIQTDWNNTIGGTNNGERMRITSIGAPGVRNPAGAPNDNITRVAISHDGSDPITDPVSLLHLGNDLGSLFPSNDGWRDWMDVGMFINKSNDNIYVGLKNEGSDLTDRYDAVISWGDNQEAVGPLNVGPDNLRFIFTSTNDIGAGDPVSTSNNGLEVARMEPTLASTLSSSNYDYGMMGIGNFAPGSPNDVGGTPVDAKLDIDGDLRIREVTEDTTLNMVLVIDTNDLNRVHWRSIGSFGGGGGIGNYCYQTQNPLIKDYEVPLNDYNYYFTGSSSYPDTTSMTNSVGIGIPCGNDLYGKLHVYQDKANASQLLPNPTSITGAFENMDTTSEKAWAVLGLALGTTGRDHRGGLFYGANGDFLNIGVDGTAYGTATSQTYGGIFEGSNGTETCGVEAQGYNGDYTYGGKFRASSGTVNYGVYAEAGGDSVGGPDFAGYFKGDVATTGGYYTVSDQNLKEHVEPIQSASDLLAQLNPVGYDFRYQQYERMNLPREHQYGLIAQELEQVLPEMVGDIVHPAEFDTLGNEIAPQMELKGVNYTQLIPLLIAGFQEQQAALNQKDEVINSLSERLTILEDCIAASHLCETGGAQNKMSNGNTLGETVTLKNHNAIILDQNLPNPFAEQTTITYVIPEEIAKAELIFYDMRGRIINQVQINERGTSRMTVYGENLQNGVYTYSLIADGKLIDTKKMVKQ